MRPPRLALALLAASLAGCLPIHETFLRPNGAGGKYAGTACGGITGTPERLLLRGPGRVRLAAELHRLAKEGEDGAPGLGVLFILHVPASQTVELTSAPFVLTDGRGAVHEARAAVAIDVDANILGSARTMADVEAVRKLPDARFTALPAVLRGTGRTRWHIRPAWFGEKLDHPYYLPVRFEAAPFGPAKLRMPEVRVDGQPYRFPEIEIRTVGAWWIAPLNC